MKTYLTFDVHKLLREIYPKGTFNEINEIGNKLQLIKKYRKKMLKRFPIELPKQIKISSEAVGLIVGEGYFSGKVFVFANSNIKTIREILEFLDQFNFDIRNYLEISIKNMPKSFMKNSKNYWEKELNMPLEKVRIRKEFNNITQNGTLHLMVFSSLFAKLINRIINFSKKKIEINNKLAVGYLKGILAAEGNINVKRDTNCLYMVRISASKEEERTHYKKCLERLDIRISCKDMPTVSKKEAVQRGWKTNKGRAGAVIISKWENFIQILKLNLLELSEEKNEKFIKHLLENKFTKQFLSFKPFIKKNFTMKDAQNYFNFKGRYVNRVLTLYKKGYLSRKKISKRSFSYSLTKKYFEVYDILNSYQNNPISQ